MDYWWLKETFWITRNAVLKDKQYLLFFPMFKNRCKYSASKFARWILISQIHSNYQCVTKQKPKSIDWSGVSVPVKSKHFNVQKIGNTFYAGWLCLSIPSFSSLFSPPPSPMSASLKRSSFFDLYHVENWKCLASSVLNSLNRVLFLKIYTELKKSFFLILNFFEMLLTFFHAYWQKGTASSDVNELWEGGMGCVTRVHS